MCLIVFNWQPNKEKWLELSANRDEFYNRPALALQQWPDHPDIYAGKDVSQGGTWLGINKSGCWAALTNVRVLGGSPENPKSRGELALNYLLSGVSPEQWLNQINAHEYAPFNLLVGNQNQLFYCTNYPQFSVKKLDAGQYVLSNAQLNTPWPKAELALQQLSITQNSGVAELAEMLNHKAAFPDNELPETGVGMEWERVLSAQMIVSPMYGTRCSSGILGQGSQISMEEITWDQAGNEVSRNKEVVNI